MLSSAEEEHIQRNGYVFEHDWRLHALVCGEPFLIDNCLCFFDGLVLSVVGFPLVDFSFDLLRLKKILQANDDFKNLSYIWYWGAHQINQADQLEGYAVTDLSSFSELDANLRISLKNFSLDQIPNARRTVRSAMKRGVVTSLMKERIFGYEHIRLLEAFVGSHKVSTINKAFLLALRSYLLFEQVSVIEARQDGKLCGFSVNSHYVRNIHVGFGMFTSRSVNGVGEALYYEAIQSGIKAGVEYLHLGNSMGNQGLYDFKKKWLPEIFQPCLYQYVFRKSELDAIDENTIYLSWCERISGRPFSGHS